MAQLLKNLKKMPVAVRASLAYTICSILQKSLGFITLPLFTELLTTEQYGQYAIYSSWSSIFMIFLTLNLAYGSFSTAMIRFEKERSGYIASIQGISLLLVTIFLAVYLPFRHRWNEILDLSTPLVILMVLEILGNFAMACWLGVKRFEYRYKSVIALTLSTALISPVIAYILVVHSEEKGFARIFGYAGVTIIVGMVLFILNAVKGKKPYQSKYWKYALGFNIPLIPYYLSQVVFNQSDRIMIDRYCGMDKAGIYNVGYQLAVVLTFVLNAVNDAYIPWLYGRIRAGRQEENKAVSNGIAVLMAVLLLGVTVMAPEIIGILAADEYQEAMWVVPPVAMSILLLFYAQLFINIQFYYEEKMLLVYASIGSAVANVILNVVFIPLFGFAAAAYTTLASYAIFAVTNYYAMRYSLSVHERPNNSCDLKGLLLILAVYAVLAAAAMALYPYAVVRYAIVAAVFVVLILQRKRILSFIEQLRNR